MIDDLLIRLRALLRRNSVERDLDDELRLHLDHEVEKLMRSGLDRKAAYRQARLSLGGVEQVKEECRDARGVASLEDLWQDVRHGLRGLRRSPGLTFLAAGMLCLAMAAAIVMFSIFQAAMLKPLPYRDAATLVPIYETRVERGINQASFTEANFWDLRAQSQSFTELAAVHSDELNLTGNGPAEKVSAMAVTAGFFRTLGITPIVGRDFLYDEDRGGFENPIVLLGNRFWRERFGGDTSIVGKTLRLNNMVCTVIGVLPPGEPLLNAQIYSPFGYRADANRTSWEFGVIGRLAPGVSPEAARADLQRVARALEQSYPKECKGMGFSLTSSNDWRIGDAGRRALWVLLGAVTFLVLIACMNLANLLLARGASRQREIAVRAVLGAGRARLMRFVMVEALLLSGLGAALGLGLAYAVLRVLQSFEIPGVPNLADADINPWVLGFLLLLTALTGVISGLAPTFQARLTGVSAALRDGDRQKGSRGQGRLRSALAAGEVALSFMLLVGAGLLIRSFNQLMNVDRGFQTENRVMFSVSFPGEYYETGAGKQFINRFFERMSASPEVVSYGAVSHRPVEGPNVGMGIDAASSKAGERRPPWAGWRVATPGYFKAIGLPLLRGRLFDEGDKPVWGTKAEPNPARRVVVSDRLSKLLYPEEDPIGKEVILWKGQGNLRAEIIGVVGDSRERGLTANPTLTVYLPYGANALTGEFVVQARTDALKLSSTLRTLVAEIDPNLPVADVRTFDDVINGSVAPQRFNTLLLGVFSGLALLLAVTGIYGVLSYTMSRRTSEIGLRMALGASTGGVLRMTIAQGMRPALLGIALGALGAWQLTGYLSSLLFNVKPFDAISFGAAAVLLLLTALAACYVPGRKAMRTDPAIALRME